MSHVPLLFLLIILAYIVLDKKEYFTNRETLAEKQADHIIKNTHYFNSDFYTARAGVPWIDAITYEDVRKLKNGGNLNKNNLIDILK
jgi:hypothetical protein